MRIKLAVIGATMLVLALALGYVRVAVVIFVVYVGWTWVRIPLERRDRLRQVDPTWHRGRRYDSNGGVRDEQD